MSQINNHLDLQILGILDDSLVKNAQSGLISGVVDKIKTYVDHNVDPDDKTGSFINMLMPGLISTTFGLLGLGKISLIMGFLARMFNFDLAGILRSIWSELKSEISGGKPTTSEKVNAIVQNAVPSAATPMTATQSLRMAKMVKMSFNQYQQTGLMIVLAAKPNPTLLSRILSFIFKVLLASASLMVAGDVANHLIGRPNAIDNPIRGGQPVGEGTDTPTSTPEPQQTIFPLNPAYQNATLNSDTTNWTEAVDNSESSIAQMLQGFAKDVYQGLDGYQSQIQSSPLFQNVVQTISWYNHQHPGSPIIFIPRIFTTKKQLVDAFISDVANKVSAPSGNKTASLHRSPRQSEPI